jgi:NADH-quinone oxidoreductase subunit H
LPFLDSPIASLRGSESGIAFYIGNLIGAIILTFKATLLVIVQIWIRWTLPRLRIDQVMTTCLKYLVPISCVLFLGGVMWPLTLSSTMGRTTLFDWPASWSEATPLRVAEAQGGVPSRSHGSGLDREAAR